MAFTGITATEAEIDQKSGANASTSYTDVMKTAALLHAESLLNSICQFNFSDAYGTLNADVKYAVTEYTASSVAREVISYDPDAIGRSTSVLKINVLTDNMNKAVKELKEKDTTAWMVKIT